MQVDILVESDKFGDLGARGGALVLLRNLGFCVYHHVRMKGAIMPVFPIPLGFRLLSV